MSLFTRRLYTLPEFVAGGIAVGLILHDNWIIGSAFIITFVLITVLLERDAKELS